MKEGCVEACIGCRHRNKSLIESIGQKKEYLQRVLNNWHDKITNVESVESSQHWFYRKKTSLNLQYIDGQWLAGMMRRDVLIPIPDCPVHHPIITKNLQLVLQHLPPYSDFPASYYYQSGSILVIVIKSNKRDLLSKFEESFLMQLKQNGIESFWLHFNASAGKRMFEKNGWQSVYGNEHLKDENGFFYGRTSFQQLVPKLYLHALEEAAAYLMMQSHDLMVDLYCGAGHSLRYWKGNKIAIELSGDGVACAKLNSSESIVLRGKCAERIPQLDAWFDQEMEMKKMKYAFVNPPRSGLEPEVLKWLVSSYQPNKIVYLSCSAGTLKRDLEQMEGSNYRVEKIIPYDFFPQTHHVETLVFVRRNKFLTF